jgi:glycosyltransferase involved in cell wall biosynthesis
MNNKTLNVSICIPVYNRTEFFEECLNSALNQSMKCPIIVVDNGSDTDFFEIQCQEKGVKYFKNEKNIGMFSNWNRCIDLVESEFIYILGDDDVLDNRFIEIFINSLNLNPDLDVFYSDFFLLKNNENNIYNSFLNNIFKFPTGYLDNGNLIINYAALFGLGFPTISCIFKKQKFNSFYTKLHASNDWLLFYSNIENCKIIGTPEKLVYYRKHSSSDTKNAKTISTTFLSHSYIYDQIIKQKCNIKLKNKAIWLSFISLTNFRSVTSKDYLKFLLNDDNIYSIYLRKNIQKSILLKLLFFFPPFLSKLLSKSLMLLFKLNTLQKK